MFYLAGISGYDFLGSVIANSDKRLIHPYVIESGLYLRYMRDHLLSLSQSWARTESDPATFSLENALAHIPIAPWLSHSPPHLILSTSHLIHLIHSCLFLDPHQVIHIDLTSFSFFALWPSLSFLHRTSQTAIAMLITYVIKITRPSWNIEAFSTLKPQNAVFW